MIEHWKGVVFQVGSGAFLAATTITGLVDIFVKIALGVVMIILGCYQIGAYRRHRRYVIRLEEMARQARIHCELAANGMCWLEAEANREREKKPQ